MKQELRTDNPEPKAYIALGSNQGDSARLLQDACRRLADLASAPILCSSLWRSIPIDCPPGSPDFENAVAVLQPRTDLTPELLLAELQRIEGEFGRRPKIVLNEPRPLDLDLIAWGREVRQSAALTLPHPRAHLRHFVLCPLAELAPDLVLPGQRQTVRQLLAALGPAPDLVQLAGSAIS